MDIQMIASFAVISTDPAADRALFVGTMALPLHGPESVEGSDYLFSDQIEGARHFGVWPLSEAAESCFGTKAWPDTHPVPQASVELEVGSPDEVDAAVGTLQRSGHRMVHASRTEPWGQVIARLQSNSGVLVGVCFTPWYHQA
jgi:uncharacterized glyoxalase superfamily protein PhnB